MMVKPMPSGSGTPTDEREDMTDWMAGPRAMQRHLEVERIVRAALVESGDLPLEMLVRPEKSSTEEMVSDVLLDDGGKLVWNDKEVVCFTLLPTQEMFLHSLAVAVLREEDGRFTGVTLTRMTKDKPWFGFSFVMDLSWVAAREWYCNKISI